MSPPIEPKTKPCHEVSVFKEMAWRSFGGENTGGGAARASRGCRRAAPIVDSAIHVVVWGAASSKPSDAGPGRSRAPERKYFMEKNWKAAEGPPCECDARCDARHRSSRPHTSTPSPTPRHTASAIHTQRVPKFNESIFHCCSQLYYGEKTLGNKNTSTDRCTACCRFAGAPTPPPPLH